MLQITTPRIVEIGVFLLPKSFILLDCKGEFFRVKEKYRFTDQLPRHKFYYDEPYAIIPFEDGDYDDEYIFNKVCKDFSIDVDTPFELYYEIKGTLMEKHPYNQDGDTRVLIPGNNLDTRPTYYSFNPSLKGKYRGHVLRDHHLGILRKEYSDYKVDRFRIRTGGIAGKYRPDIISFIAKEVKFTTGTNVVHISSNTFFVFPKEYSYNDLTFVRGGSYYHFYRYCEDGVIFIATCSLYGRIYVIRKLDASHLPSGLVKENIMKFHTPDKMLQSGIVTLEYHKCYTYNNTRNTHLLEDECRVYEKDGFTLK